MAVYRAVSRGSYGNGVWIDYTVTENSTNIANNTSVVGWKLELVSSSAYSEYGTLDYNCYINGVKVSGQNEKSYSLGTSSRITIASGTRTVTHNSNGAKSVSASATVVTPYGGSDTASGTLKLTTFDRYLAFTTITVNNEAVNSVQARLVTDATFDNYAYSTNNGSSYLTFARDDTDHTFTISGLNPATTYNFKFGARKADSNQWTYSGTYTRTTLGYANITSFTETNIRDRQFTVSVATDVGINELAYSLDGGAYVVVKDGSTFSSHSFTLSGLLAGKEYTIKVRVKRADSGLYTESSVHNVQLLNSAKFFGGWF